MKKLISFILILMLIACTAWAEEPKKEEYRPLGETGFEMWIAPGMQTVELTQEDLDNGYIQYYEDSTRTKAIAVVYFTDISLTLEEYKSYLDGDTTVTDIGITEVNGIPCIRYQMSLEGFDILNVAFVLENNDILEVTFSPYDDPDYAGTIETMYSSIRKTI